MGTHVRPVRPDDLARVTDLLAQLGHPTTTDKVRDRLDRWLDDRYSVLLAAEVASTVAGMAALHAMPPLEHEGCRGRLVALVVDDAYRRHGVGRALMSRVEQEARELGCRDLEITSARYREPAQRFYLEVGYEDTCDRAARFLKNLTP